MRVEGKYPAGHRAWSGLFVGRGTAGGRGLIS